MRELLSVSVLVILSVLAGCSGTPSTAATGSSPTPPAVTEAPLPTESLVPAETATERPTALPTKTPNGPPVNEPTNAPTPTPPRESEMLAGVMSPLSLHDTEDVNSELSGAELACLKEGSPGLHLGWAFILPGYGNPRNG